MILHTKPIKAQNNTKTHAVDTMGYYQKSVDIMNKFKHLNPVARALDTKLNNGGIKFTDEKGNLLQGTHYLGTTEFDNQIYAYPHIVQKSNNTLEYIPDWREAVEYNKNKRELIPLGFDQDFADYFSSVGYKYKFPKKDYEEAKKEYIKRTNIKQ